MKERKYAQMEINFTLCTNDKINVQKRNLFSINVPPVNSCATIPYVNISLVHKSAHVTLHFHNFCLLLFKNFSVFTCC